MSESNLLAGSARMASEERSRSDGGLSYDEHHQRVAPIAIGVGPLPVGRYLANGDSVELAVDGTTPVHFDLLPATDEIIRVNRISLVLVTASAFEMTEFGDLAALATGLTLSVLDADLAEITDLLGGQPMRSHDDLAALFDLQVLELATSQTLIARLTLPAPLRLDGGLGERLRMTVQDDLSSLTRLRCRIDGALEDTLT